MVLSRPKEQDRACTCFGFGRKSGGFCRLRGKRALHPTRADLSRLRHFAEAGLAGLWAHEARRVVSRNPSARHPRALPSPRPSLFRGHLPRKASVNVCPRAAKLLQARALHGDGRPVR